MNKLKSLSTAQMVLPQRSLYRRRIPLFLSDIPVAVSNCRLYCHLLFALNPLSIHFLCFIKGLARPMSLYKPRRQEWLGRGTCLVNTFLEKIFRFFTIPPRWLGKANCEMLSQRNTATSGKHHTCLAHLFASLGYLECICLSLVAVGDQSSSKLLLLEGLTNIPFPRDLKRCTR